ncbi:MAG: endonuclease/exonuclease/phosphatase family protein [Bacteroidota bacterium]
MRRLFPVFFILFSSALLIVSCDDNTTGPDEPEPDPPLQIPIQETVPADNQLETITWNLEWFGSTSNGPGDERRQLKNVLTVIDSLDADFYALQEVYSESQIDSLTKYMTGYEGYVATHIDWIQKTAFLYNSETISNVSTDFIGEDEGLDEYHFAGRFPFVLNFDYSYEGGSHRFMAIVIHAKCCTDREDYERRKAAAESLYNYLQNNHPRTSIIFLGDYNDDIDESIYGTSSGYELTPYYNFKQNSDAFTVVTGTLGLDGTSSTVRYDDVIDHITYSNEVMPYYVEGSAEVVQSVEKYIEAYGNTTSDHYPVRAIISFD